MKKLLTSLFFLIVSFTTNGIAATPGNIHEYTVDLYYANGVLATDEQEAKYLWMIRVKDLRKANPSLKKALKYGEAKLAYNASYLWGVGDFFEAFFQYTQEEALAKVTWEAFKKFAAKTLYGKAATMATDLATITGLDTESNQREAYQESINRGHGVITVAHSQGNFFTNQVFNDIVSLKSWMKPYMHMISVASPSKKVFGNGPHVTFDNDMITIIPGNLTFTHTNPNRKGYQYKDKSYSDELSDVYHGFNYYMGEEVNEHDGKHGRDKVSTQIARIDIEKYIMNALDAHLNTDSQWEKKKDYGCLCKDKRIIMKHKWDAELTKKLASTKVFEFDEDGKLYHVLNQEMTGLEYARSASRYGASIEDIEEGEVCYELVNYDNGRLGIIEGRGEPLTMPQISAIMSKLTWSNIEADFELEVQMPNGHTLEGCGEEVFYIETPKEIKAPAPGTTDKYPVIVKLNNKNELEEDNSSVFPMEINLSIVTPGDSGTFVKYITKTGNGTYHIADIEISMAPDGTLETPKLQPTLETFQTSNFAIRVIDDSNGSNNTPSVTYHNCPECPKYTIPSPPYYSYGGGGGGSWGGWGGWGGGWYYGGWYGLGSPSTTYINFDHITAHVTAGCAVPSLRPRDEGLIPGNPYVDANSRNSQPNSGDGDGDDDGTCQENDCGCLPCEYRVVEILKQAYLGPLKNATVRLYNASEYHLDDAVPLYEGKTFDSNELDKAGTISIVSTDIPEDADTFLVMEIIGGEDIDYDDNFLVDAKPTPFRGVLQALIPKKVMQDESPYKVNILTKIAFDVSKKYLGADYNATLLKEHLDDVAQKILIDKIYKIDDTPLGYNDLLYWLPVDSSLLVKSYSKELLPIMKKLFAGVNIEEEAYSFVYDAPRYFDVPVLQRSALSIEEHADIGAEVGNITIIAGKPGKIVLSGEGSENFNVNSEGLVTVANGVQLDYETDIGYMLKATPWDESNATAGTPVNVIIYLEDIVDAPVITSIRFTQVFKENMSEGDEVAQILVNPDIPVDTFSLSGEDAQSFTIDAEGMIRVSAFAQLDYETKKAYSFIVTATNTEGDSLAREFRLVLADDATDKPQVLYFDGAVAEGAAHGTVLGVVKTIENEFPIVKLELSGKGSSDFSLTLDGTLSVSDSANIVWLDRNVYNLSVTAIDSNGTRSNPEPVVIFVVKPQGVPILEPSVINLNIESISVGDRVAQVKVKEEGDAPIDRIVDKNPGAVPFEVQEDGNITYQGYGEVAHSYMLWASAFNAMGESYPQFVQINILSNLPVVKDTYISIRENTQHGEQIGTLIFFSDSPITGAELSGEGSEQFKLDTNGSLYLTEYANLDYEKRNFYQLALKVSNKYGVGKEAKLTIRIKDSRDIPVLQHTILSVAEYTQGGEVVGNVIVKDEGLSSIEGFTISSDSTFEIDNNGTVRVANNAVISLDHKSQYDLSVTAYNKEGVSMAVPLKIMVSNVHETPVLDEMIFSIEENSTSGTVIGQTHILQEGFSEIIYYEWRGQGSEKFTINRSGKISISPNTTLDYETQSKYVLSVRAHNSHGVGTYASMTINIEDIIDAPVLDETNLSVKEDSIPGTLIGQINVAHEGLSKITSFELSGQGSEKFIIDKSGKISVASGAILDFETQKQYRLAVRALNAQGSSKSALVVIDIENVAGAVPKAYYTYLSVDENASIGTVVGKLRFDSKETSIINIELLDENNTFSVDLNGTIRVIGELDYETRYIYELGYRVTNAFGVAESYMNIEIKNILDVPELRTSQEYDAYKNISVGSIVFETSFHQGASPLQDVELFGEGSEYLEGDIHDNNVSIKVSKSLLEAVAHKAYWFELQVSNKAGKSKKIPFYLRIKDRRDIPILANTNLYIDENASAGTVVGNINITSDGYSPITDFKIIPIGQWYSWPDGYFKIDSNGTVRIDTNASLDYETIRRYAAYVIAVNGIGESEKAWITIDLNDIPDTVPTCADGTLELGPISKGIDVNTSIGYGGCYTYDSAFVSAKLEPSSPFEAVIVSDSSGYYSQGRIVIKTVSSLKNIDVSEYNLSLSVTNATGESNKRPVHIVIDENNYVFDMMQGDINKVLGKINLGTEKVRYVSTDNSLFSIDMNGTLKGNDGYSNGYKPQYNFNVIVGYDDYTQKKIAVTVNVQSRVLSELSIPGYATKIILNKAKTRAYITNDNPYTYNNNQGLVVVNIEDANNPQLISSIVTDGKAKDIVLSKDEKYIYLLDAGKGIKIIDISDEKNLQLVSALAFGGATYQFASIDLSVDGNTLYMAHRTYGIEIIDVSDPLSPEIMHNIGFLGTIENGGDNYNNKDVPAGGYSDIVSDGNVLYSVDLNYGLQVIDISDLENPVSIYSESLKDSRGTYSATDVYLNKEENIISVLSANDVPMTLYSIDDSAKISKIKQDYTYDNFEILDNDIAFSAKSSFTIYDAYNPTNMEKLLTINFGYVYGEALESMALDKEKNIAYATRKNGFIAIDLSGIEKPIHYEPVLAGTDITIAEENLTAIIADNILGNVSILKTGNTPIVKMWTDLPKYKSGGVDCGYTYYAQPIDKNCENDYSYFDIDKDGNIQMNDTDSLAYENVGNMIPFSVYAENEDGYTSEQAKVMIKVIENPDLSLKFQRPTIKIDSNVSIDTEIGNVLLKKSQRELFLFDMYEHKNPEYQSCNRSNFYNYYTKYPNSMSAICSSPDYFEIDSDGVITVAQTPLDGNYSVNIFAVDRFGLKSLENLIIEVLP